MNKDLRLVVDLFKFYVIQISGNKNYKFKMTDSRYKMILNFISKFKEETKSDFLAKDNLRKFIEYQFNYWYKHDSNFGKGISIQIEWIIGAKAFKRWESRTEKQKKSTDFIIRKNLKKDIKIFEFDSSYSDSYKKMLLEVRDYEEIEKKRFYNTKKGFANCIVSTTLYNHNSELCISCKNALECKPYMKKIMYKVYKLRGYDK